SAAVAEPDDAGRAAVDGALAQPLERSLEELRAVPLPHRVVRRAAEVDEDLRLRTGVLVQLAGPGGVHLTVVDRRDGQERGAARADDLAVPPPGHRPGCAAVARPPAR